MRVVRVEGGELEAPDSEKMEAKRVKSYVSKGIDSFEFQEKSYLRSADAYRKMKSDPNNTYYTPEECDERIAQYEAKAKWCGMAVDKAKTVNHADKDFQSKLKTFVLGMTTFNLSDADIRSVHAFDSQFRDAFKNRYTRLDFDAPEDAQKLKEWGFIEYDGEITPWGFAVVMSYDGMLHSHALRNWASGDTASSKRLVLHCVAGRGKKSVRGGDEESPENVAKSYEGVAAW
jgi:hypothetical protein